MYRSCGEKLKKRQEKVKELVLIDWGPDRGLLFCSVCKRKTIHDIDETMRDRKGKVNAKKLPKNVPVICRKCNRLKFVNKIKWIKTCKELLSQFVPS